MVYTFKRPLNIEQTSCKYFLTKKQILLNVEKQCIYQEKGNNGAQK